MDEMAGTGKAQRAKDGSGIEGDTGAKEGVGAKNALKGESVARVPKLNYVKILIYLIAFVWAAYGVISFIAPELNMKIWNAVTTNTVGALGVFPLVFILFAWVRWLGEKAAEESFVEIDRKARFDLTKKLSIASARLRRSMLFESVPVLGSIAVSGYQQLNDSERLDEVPQGKVEELFRLNSAFEMHVVGVIGSLERHISVTEEKGSKLLDRGLLFLFGGILFYVGSIAVWQYWGNQPAINYTLLYVGMASGSVVFLICEFLAAWFLKQYRHYVDASISCLRVKSVYDRYLLNYYAVKELGGTGGDGFSESQGARELSLILDVLKEDVNWPGHKENVKNDFNYMLQSMDAVYSSVDKVRSIFQSAKSYSDNAKS
ncbi:TPA: hypothetical protein ACXI2A_001528 [Pseudomonas aeruginosa]|uniref:hypothetical protein n=1 Tax=Pseudomonas aeruginosa TaxID=287 RepID=UPI0030CAAAED